MKILYVEDEVAHVLLAQRTLEENLQHEFTLVHAETIRQALGILDVQTDIDLILSDLRLPDGTGLDLLKKVRERESPPAVVLVTGQGDQEVAVAALKAGAADYLVKQSDYLHRLPIVISNAVAQNRYLREQAALRDAEIKYQSLVEQISAVVFLDDINDTETTLYMSPRIQELTGYTSEEWRADPDIWIKCIHPDDQERIAREYEKSHRYGTTFTEEYRLIRRNGSTVWVKEDTNLIRDKDGNPSYWQGILLDITKERETQAIIQESEERFRRVFHASPIATCVVVLEDGKFIDANQAFLDLIGKALKELLGRTSVELGFWQAGRREFFVSQLRERGGLQGIETQYTNVPNGPKDTLAYYELIDLGGQPCILAMFYEVTEQKRAQKSMQRQLQELSVLHAAAIASAESYSEDEIIERVTKITAQLYTEICGIILLNEKNDMLIPHASCIGADFSNWRQGYPLTEGLTGKAVRLGKILRTGEARKEGEYIEIASGIQSELCVPIRVNERVIGVLNVESQKANAFDEGDERFLNTIAGGLGTTLEKLRLSKDEQQRARQLNSLYQATKSLTESLKPEVIAEKLIANMDEMLGYEFGSVYLIEVESQALILLAISQKAQNLDIYEKDMGLLITKKRALGTGILGWVAKHGQSIRSGDVTNDSRYLPVIKNIRSELCVPLIARGKTIGVVNIETTKPHAYTDADENLLSALAGSAAIALENAQLYEAELKRREQAELLREATAALTTSIEPDALYEIILDSLLKLVPYDSASIELLDDDYWEIVAERGLPSEYSFIGKRYKTDHTKWAPLNNQQQPVIVRDVHLDARFVKFEGTEYIRSWMGIPMYTHGKMIGYLNLDSRIVNFFTAEHAAIAQTFGNQAATAFENARLFKSEQRRRREAETLRLAATAISSTLDLNSVMEDILRALKQVIEYDSASVFLHEGDWLRLAVCQGFAEPAMLINKKFPASDPLLGKIRETRQPVIIQDVQKDPLFKNWGNTQNIHGWMATPLLNRGRIIGYITLDNYKPAAYDESNIETAMAFAYQAAAAIENARLYDETQRRLGELETINRLSTSLRTTQPVDEMLNILLNETLYLLQTEHGSIWLYDPAEDLLFQRAARGELTHLKNRSLKISEGHVIGKAFLSGKVHVSTESIGDSAGNVENQHNNSEDIRAACIPIQSTAGTMGVLIISVSNSHPIADQMNLLTTLAEIAGNSIHRAQLFEHSREQIQRLTTLRDIDSAIASSFDLRLTLNILMDQTMKHLGLHAVDITLYHPDLQTITYLGGLGFQFSSATRPQVRIGEGLAGRVIIRHKTFHITDLQNSPEINNEPLLKREGFVTYIGIPLIVKGQIKGVFEVFHRAPLLPTPDWMEFLHTLAGQAAIAIDNSQLFENLQRSNQELIQAYDTTLEGWARALELRDRETEGHTRRVTELTLRLAEYMGISESELVNIHRGVLLHDIGKMGVPDHILKKTGPLTENEWQEMRQHPVYAYNLLSPISYLRGALDIPYSHHEHWDGNGYPRGLKGEQIPLAARIFSVVDIWDALLSDRPYRKAWRQDKVIEYLKDIAGTHLDTRIVEVFLRMIAEDESATYVSRPSI